MAADSLSMWGEVMPGWLTALATTGALVAAGIAGWYTKGLLDNDDARESARLCADQRAQAERIAAWWPSDDEKASDKRLSGDNLPLAVRIRNASDVPVYAVVLHYTVNEKSVATDSVDLVPPGDKLVAIPQAVQAGYLEATGQQRRPAAVRVLITFTDAAGQQWTRDHSGILTKRS